jgi:imidazole glycerol-phosphate synthase subunit HisH
MITIVNYKMGNIRSIVNALDYLGVSSHVTSSPKEILASEKLILPGVGSYNIAMKNLHEMGLIEPLNEVVLVKKRPILGICLGMQLLADRGAEDGEVKGLSWIAGRVVRFKFNDPFCRIPHTGFNSVRFSGQKSVLFNSLKDHADFYFVHSFHMVCEEDQDVSGWADYNGDFVASVEKGNVYGTQFHPEKSQSNGLVVLRNFAGIEYEYA